MSYISAFKEVLAKCKEVAHLQEKSTVRVLIRYVYLKLRCGYTSDEYFMIRGGGSASGLM